MSTNLLTESDLLNVATYEPDLLTLEEQEYYDDIILDYLYEAYGLSEEELYDLLEEIEDDEYYDILTELEVI